MGGWAYGRYPPYETAPVQRLSPTRRRIQVAASPDRHPYQASLALDHHFLRPFHRSYPRYIVITVTAASVRHHPTTDRSRRRAIAIPLFPPLTTNSIYPPSHLHRRPNRAAVALHRFLRPLPPFATPTTVPTAAFIRPPTTDRRPLSSPSSCYTTISPTNST